MFLLFITAVVGGEAVGGTRDGAVQTDHDGHRASHVHESLHQLLPVLRHGQQVPAAVLRPLPVPSTSRPSPGSQPSHGDFTFHEKDLSDSHGGSRVQRADAGESCCGDTKRQRQQQ